MKLDEHQQKIIHIILINWEWKDFGVELFFRRALMILINQIHQDIRDKKK